MRRSRFGRRRREGGGRFGFVRDSFGSCFGSFFLLTLLLESGLGDGEEERAVELGLVWMEGID